MTHEGIRTRSMALLRITLFFTLFCYPALGFFHPLPASQLTSSNNCQLQQRLSSSRAVCARQRQLRSATLSDGTSVGACSFSGISLSRERSMRGSRLRMSSYAAPPVKPPKKRGWGGGGRGDDLYVRELVEPEKSEILTAWRDYAKADGSERFMESIQILNEMIAWRSGVIAARKRRFTLACCKGTAVQAVACVQIGPKNESVRSFLAQDACMSLCLLIVDPEAPMFKAGAHLCKEIKEIGRSENMAVDFQPIKDIYSGRFYAATLAM